MKITLLTPGKVKKPYLREGCEDYLSRLKHYAQMQLLEVKEEPITKKATPALVKEREASRLVGKIPPGAVLIALDEGGHSMASQALADLLQNLRDEGRRELVFVIGGPLGLGNEILRSARLRLSLSAMTLPHDLARLVLLEQLYRAFTIIHGEPYHNP